jgi:hypothetical protein
MDVNIVKVLLWTLISVVLHESSGINSENEHVKALANLTSNDCVFPFTYKGHRIDHCINYGQGDDDGSFWCSLSKDYKPGLWRYCFPEDDCVFPFTFNGKTYNACTSDGLHSSWCSRTRHYRGDNQWKYCKPSNDCIFPFTFNRQTFHSCTNYHRHKSWCALTREYHGDEKYKLCITSKDCVFPFIYKGVEYKSCIKRDFGNESWCSLSDSYDRDQLRKVCSNLLSPQKVRQSNVKNDGRAKKAVDEDNSTCTETQDKGHPWWLANLGDTYNVESVRIQWKRDDLNSFLRINIGDIPKTPTMINEKGEMVDGYFTTHINRDTQYIRITLDKEESLSLCEVKIFGNPKTN